MKLFGFEITFSKAPVGATTTPANWDTGFGSSFWSGGWGNMGSWFPIVKEPFTGAWQRNQDLQANTLLAFPALYRCITLISQDISKMRMRLMEENPTTGISTEVDRNSPYAAVLIKPNHYQNRIQFFDEWMGSKLIQGNTYVLKGRDGRGIVTSLNILNPWLTIPLVSPNGDVYYELSPDNLNIGIEERGKIRVPASEIIHDRYKPLYHPLWGIPPIMACALSGSLGVAIADASARFFKNKSMPGGVLSAPSRISDEAAKRLKEHWENNYTGVNSGRVAVLGDGLKFEAMKETSVDAQLVEQLKMSGENVCTAFGVPPYKIGIGDMPAFNNIEALDQQYYSQCLQNLIETIELLMDEGLGLVDVAQHNYESEFDIEDLLRMDTATKSKTWGDLVKQGIAAPNEARQKFNLIPKKGGDSVFLQQQNYSLEALAKRDALDNPFATNKPSPQPMSQPGNTPQNGSNITAALAERIRKSAKHELLRFSS